MVEVKQTFNIPLKKEDVLYGALQNYKNEKSEKEYEAARDFEFTAEKVMCLGLGDALDTRGAGPLALVLMPFMLAASPVALATLITVDPIRYHSKLKDRALVAEGHADELVSDETKLALRDALARFDEEKPHAAGATESIDAAAQRAQKIIDRLLEEFLEKKRREELAALPQKLNADKWPRISGPS